MRGFTLTELIVVVAVVAFLAVLAVPVFSVWLPGYKLKSVAQDLYSNMQAAKLRAIKESVTSGVSFYAEPDRYVFSLSGVTRTVTLADYGYGVNFDGPSGETFDTAYLSFDPRGFSSGANAYLSNAGETAYYRVGALGTGAVRLQKWEGGAWQ